MQTQVPLRIERHDDGGNAWRFARATPAPGAGEPLGYCDYWERTTTFDTRRETPHAEGVLIFNLGGPLFVTDGAGRRLRLGAGEAFVAGAHLRPAFSQTLGSQAGLQVALPLTALRRLLGAPMRELQDRVAPLDALIGPQARAWGRQLGEIDDPAARIAMIDAALRDRLASAAPLCAGQTLALQRLRRRPDLDVADIARDIGWSRKHLAARVEDAVGVGPRAFRRLLRFQTLTAAIRRDAGGAGWAALSAEAGYFDQSHMIRDFHEFVGMTPSAYRARTLPHSGGLVES